jgi:small-conductance mechanosensitive channel
MAEESHPEQDVKQVHAYHRMVERVKDALHLSQDSTLPGLQRAIDTAKDRAVELDELTREEAERIGDYLQRDLRDAAEYLVETGDELSAWLQFDLELIGERIAEHLPVLVDQTRLELEQELERLSQEAQEVGQWESGEVTVGGTFRCIKCGQTLRLFGPTQIAPCTRCQGTVFQRVAGPSDSAPA